MQSYDSLSGGTSRSEMLEGSGGRVYAGPRVRVRRGRTAKLPAMSIGISWEVEERLVDRI